MTDEKEHDSLQERMNALKGQSSAGDTPVSSANDENKDRRVEVARNASQKPLGVAL